jgi:hypothetical protein
MKLIFYLAKTSNPSTIALLIHATMPPRNDGAGIACLFKNIRLLFYLPKTSNPSTIALLTHATMPPHNDGAGVHASSKI